METTHHYIANAWYIKYPLDAYALGPCRYTEKVDARHVSDDALERFGGRPREIWPDSSGQTEEVEEYTYEVSNP